MDQQGQFWQSNAQPNADFVLSSNGPDGDAFDADGETVAVVISVSGDLAGDFYRHLEHRTHKIKSILFARPTRNLDRHCLRDAGDAVALADGVKTLMREFAKRHGATRVLLYYLGPLSGACFIGHRLNCRVPRDPDHGVV